MNRDEWEEERRHFLRLCTWVVLGAAVPRVFGNEVSGRVGTCAERSRSIAHHSGAPCAPYGYPEAAYYRALPEDES